MKPSTILVVDDNESVRRFTIKALRSQGFHTLEAFDGRSGLETFVQHKNEGRFDSQRYRDAWLFRSGHGEGKPALKAVRKSRLNVWHGGGPKLAGAFWGGSA